jgi:glycosyltransferase involved in cell wall biosynthesis
VKLAIVVPGGVARVPGEGWIPALHWLIDRLARRHEVHVVSLAGAPRPERYAFLGATVHHAGARGAAPRALAAILAEHRRGRFDVLHAFWASPPGLVAAAAGKLLRRPVLLHVAGGELVALPDIGYGHGISRRGRLWTRLALAGAARITAASAPMLEAIRAAGHAAVRVPLGVDLERWPPAAPRARAPGAPVRLVHVASLNRVKDQTTLLHAARRLLERGLDFRLDVAGGDTLDGAIQALARDLRLAERVCFHGYLPQERLRPVVLAADVLWLSSRHEAGPLAVLEAAVLGVPTVGTAVGHVAEWAPRAAVAVPVGDADALARETELLLGDEARRLRLAAEAQRRALECDADWTARRLETLYHELAGGPRPGDAP